MSAAAAPWFPATVWEGRLRTLAIGLGTVVCAAGVLTIASWAAGATILPSGFDSATPVRFNTGLCLALLGAALALQALGRAPRGSRVLAAIAIAIAAVTLAEYLLDRDLGIDQALFDDPASAGDPGRMAPKHGDRVRLHERRTAARPPARRGRLGGARHARPDRCPDRLAGVDRRYRRAPGAGPGRRLRQHRPAQRRRPSSRSALARSRSPAGRRRG